MLQNLKKNYVTNAHEIFNLEREINEIQEQDLRDELNNYKQFERLNNEKITPYFMKLVKQSCAADSLDGINYDTTEYNCRDDAITGFYEKLYRKPEESRECTVESIEDFLGPSANTQTVTDAKLNQHEKNCN
jgi:hypothetical protein